MCATGIQTGESSTIDNQGTIITNDILAFGIDAGRGSSVTNAGSIQTNDLAGHGIFVDDFGVVTNEDMGTIETLGLGAIGINGRNNVQVINRGLIRTSNQGSHGIDLLDNGTVVNAGTIVVADFQSVGVRLQDGTATVVNSGTIQSAFDGLTDPNNPEDGLQITGTVITIDNSGLITTTAAGGAAIRVSSEGNGDISISNSGTLTGSLKHLAFS